jgi:hypothetical protein
MTTAKRAPKRVRPARKAVKAVKAVPKRRKPIRARRAPLAPRTIEGERILLNFRITSGEKETLEQIAEREGIALSELIRLSLHRNFDLPEPELKKKREELISG